ncbi:MAG: hypothetical protein AUK63_1257 [bacterium P3]|nr:MAG: hypothetical protein AUK63_1257 [bacterium P3]KWW40365.1 MAG: hypothetical protein F083_1602 [bacterium F083]
MSNICVVFNNRRSGLFLRNCLRELGPRSFFLPETIGMDDIVRKICGLEIIPKEYLLFELYDIHRGISQDGAETESFEQFIPFGETMLNDFSEIDLYLADAAQLFDNLYELKSIGEWDIAGAALTPFQRNYLNFYRSLYHHYMQLRQRLSEQGKAYGGMAYRMAAETVEDYIFDEEHIYFVGFNALSTSEETIIRTLQRQGRATLISDGDAYYFDNPGQEAGRFLRRLAHQFDSIGGYDDHFALEQKQITFVNSPENLLQTKYAGNLLRQMADKDTSAQQLQDTAVVLADENLLIPMLNSLPDNVPAVNVTMGYPLESTAIHTFTLKLIACCKNIRGQQLYHKDVIDILSDTCSAFLIKKTTHRHAVRQYLYERQQVFVDLSVLRQLAGTLQIDIGWMEPLFSIGPDCPDAFIELCRQLAERLQADELFARNKKDAASLASYLTLNEHFADLQRRYGFIDRIDTFERIYTRMAHRSSIPFYGEPLHGLQILGMLETRNLDFRRVILLSANEGVLPSGRQENTLIPFNLKRAAPFHLPTHEEKDAVYANHFYRLLQRAEEIYIVYSSQTDGSGKGEPSRFAMQLTDELARTHPNIHIRQEIVSPGAGGTASGDNPGAVIHKTAAIMKRLQQLAGKGFSPSALNTYRNCPLKYYFRYIMQVRENDELEDSLDKSQFGTLVHTILQDLYGRLGNRPLTVADMLALQNSADECIEAHFSAMGRDFVRHGRTYLQQRIAQKQIKHLIHDDIAFIESGNSLQIAALEHPFEGTVELHDGRVARLQGVADRIDLINGHLRIVDYKTGKVEEKELVTDDKQVGAGELSDKSFQVLMYTWLYLHDKAGSDILAPNTEFIESGIYPLGNLRMSFLPLRWNNNPLVTLEQAAGVGALIADIVSQILDPLQPFAAPGQTQQCHSCLFVDVCPRHLSANGGANCAAN